MLNSRIKKRVDTARLGSAVGYPGIDPRSWVTTARVDDHPDAITWDPKIGWLIDVTFSGGDMDGEGPVPCRVASSFAGTLEGSSEPVTRGGEVLILLPDGDPNSTPTILAQLHNEGGCDAPHTVNGHTVDEAFALTKHFTKSTHGYQAEYAQDWAVHADNVDTTGEQTALLEAGSIASVRAGTTINLGGTASAPPTEPVIKGQQLVTALAQLNANLVTLIASIQSAVGGIVATGGVAPVGAPAAVAIGVALAAFSGQVGSFNAAANAALSLKSKVE